MALEFTKILSGFENFLDKYESSDALQILRDEFEFSDDDIREIGLDYLFPEPDEPEPKEEPLKTYTFIYHAYLDTTIEVKAPNEEAAEALAEDIAENEIIYADMECYDAGLELIEASN